MSNKRSSVAILAGALLAAIGALSPVFQSSPSAGADTTITVIADSEYYTTSTNTCRNNSTIRNGTDALDASWRAATGATQFEIGEFGAATDVATNPVDVQIGDVTVSVSKRELQETDRLSYDDDSWGTLGVASYRDPYLSQGSTMQDCSPRPARLYSTSGQPTYWNAIYGSGSLIDGIHIEFSEPVQAFGAWFGDLESRTDGGEVALIKLFAADGSVIGIEELAPTRAVPHDDDPTGRTTCGGTADHDALACGNQATRFIGFTSDAPVVSSMLLIVGDDDGCDEFPTGCNGGSEAISMIGPQLALDIPVPTTTTSTTTTTTSTTTTSTTTTSTTTTSTTTTTSPSTTTTTTAPVTTSTVAPSTTIAPAPTTTAPAPTTTLGYSPTTTAPKVLIDSDVKGDLLGRSATNQAAPEQSAIPSHLAATGSSNEGLILIGFFAIGAGFALRRSTRR